MTHHPQLFTTFKWGTCHFSYSAVKLLFTTVIFPVMSNSYLLLTPKFEVSETFIAVSSRPSTISLGKTVIHIHISTFPETTVQQIVENIDFSIPLTLSNIIFWIQGEADRRVNKWPPDLAIRLVTTNLNAGVLRYSVLLFTYDRQVWLPSLEKALAQIFTFNVQK